MLSALASRREFLTTSLAAPWLSATARKPNIIWIMADDLGIGDLGCYGQKRIQTPSIDSLARDGMRFTNAYSGACVCAPSRNTLMTGQHTGHTSVRANHSKRNRQRVPLRSTDITVAQVLKKAGYRTGLVGKWGLGEPGTTGIPNRQGFDYFYGFLNQDHAADHYTDYLWWNERKETIDGNAGGAKRVYVHDLFTTRALQFISASAGSPFFLYLAYTLPHAEMVAPDYGPYENESWTSQQKTYAAMVTRLDSGVGQVLNALREQGIEKDTLVFFTSDNGATFAPAIQFFHSTGGFRGTKRTHYEGGVRAPMLARWPGRIAAGAESSTPWAFWDFLPTAAEVVGAQPPAGIDGVSILPSLLGNRQDLSRRPLYWESHERNGFSQAIRLGKWKALRQGLTGALELYDLESDPAESNNLAAAYPGVIRQMEELLRTMRTDNEEYPVAG